MVGYSARFQNGHAAVPGCDKMGLSIPVPSCHRVLVEWAGNETIEKELQCHKGWRFNLECKKDPLWLSGAYNTLRN